MFLTEFLNEDILSKGDYSDVILRIFGDDYKLHRVILGQNPFFHSILQDESSRVDITQSSVPIYSVSFPDYITREVFNIGLLYIYGLPAEDHEFAIIQNSGHLGLCALLAMGHLLSLQKLRHACLSKLEDHINIGNTPGIASEFTIHHSHYDGDDSSFVLEVCRLMLCSRGFSLPVEFWSQFTLAPEVARLALIADEFYVPTEWHRYCYLVQVYEHCVCFDSDSSSTESASNNMKKKTERSKWVNAVSKIKWKAFGITNNGYRRGNRMSKNAMSAVENKETAGITSSKVTTQQTANSATGSSLAKTESKSSSVIARANLVNAIVDALNNVRYCYFSDEQLGIAHDLRNADGNDFLVDKTNLELGLWLRTTLRLRLLNRTSYSPPQLNVEKFQEPPLHAILGSDPVQFSEYPAIRFAETFYLKDLREALNDVQARRGQRIEYAGSSWTLVLARVRKHYPDIALRLAREGDVVLKETLKDIPQESHSHNPPTFDQRQRSCARFQVVVSYLPADGEEEQAWRKYFRNFAVIQRLPIMTHYFVMNVVQGDAWQEIPCLGGFVTSDLKGSIRFTAVLTLL